MIKLKDVVLNKDRKFGSADYYIHAHVKDENDEVHAALFTPLEIQKGVKRATINKEDIKEFSEPTALSYMWYKIKNFFRFIA